MQRRPKKVKPVWHEVDGAKLVEEGLGRVTERYMWKRKPWALEPRRGGGERASCFPPPETARGVVLSVFF